MLSFVARAFRSWMNVLLWLILIGCAISAFITGGTFFGGRGFSFGYAIFGLLIGGLVGLISIVFGGGLIANFLNMVDNIEAIKYHLSRTGNTSGGSSSGMNLSSIPPIVPVNMNSGDTWTCKKCGEKNPNTSSFCKDCGTFK